MNPSRFLCCRLCCGALVAVCCALVGVRAVRADEVMRQVQEELRKRNLYFGDVNGLHTPQVAAALRRYQQRKGFQPTGEADEITLRALSLVAASGLGGTPGAVVLPEAPVPPTPPLVDAQAVPWPDLPVLRSDQGRESADPAEADPANPDPTPSPKPPPAAAFQADHSEEQLRGFVEDFLKRGESNNPDAQTDFFAEQVDYFDDGNVDKRFIARDTARYNKRWPVRQFALVSPVQSSGTADAAPDKLVVNFRCRFNVRQSEREKDPKEVKGAVDITYTLTRHGSEKWRIIGIKEQRVRGK